MNRKTALLSFILITIFVATSILALMTAKKATKQPIIDQSNNPDFFMVNATYTKFNREGDINNRIITTKITHLSKNNTYLFDNPVITVYSSEEKPWLITSKQGRSEKGKSKVYLWDDVKLRQKSGANNPDFDIATSSLTIYHDAKRAETEQSITIIQNGDVAKSVGAQIDFKTGVVKLISKIKMLYQIN